MKRRLLAALLALALCCATLMWAAAEDAAAEDPEVAPSAQPAVVEEKKAEPEPAPAQEAPKQEPEPVAEPAPVEEPEPEPEPAPVEEPVSEPVEPPKADPAPAPAAEAACPHAVTEPVVNRLAPDIEYVDLEDGTHRINGKSIVKYVCAKCGATVRTADTFVEEHTYGDDPAAGCIYCTPAPAEAAPLTEPAADHVHSYTDGPYMVRGELVSAAPSADAPAETHLAKYQERVAYKCATCGEYGPSVPEEGKTIDVVEPHAMSGEACVICGYTPGCDHPEASRAYSVAPTDAATARAYGSDLTVEPGDADAHILRYTYRPYWQCQVCGYREYLSDTGEAGQFSEAHVYVDGVCALCGYECPHDAIEGKEHKGAAYYDYDDEEGHYLVTPILVDGVCGRCGMTLKNYETGVEFGETEPHKYRKGVCNTCGYECDHPEDMQVEETSKPYYNYYEEDRHDHLVVRAQRYRVLCQQCGHVLYQKEEHLGSFLEAHDMEDGECLLCGYERKVKEKDDDDDDEEEPEDEGDGFVDLLSDERLNGVAVTDGLTLIEAAKRVGDAMQHDADAGYLRVSVVNIEKVLSTDELARLERLPVRDKLIVVLNYVGFRDSVTRAMLDDPYLVSGDARALMQSIDARISGLDDSGRRGVNNALRRFFPMSVYQIRPGVTTEVFDLDLRVTEGATVTTQRYGFHQAGSDWTLIHVATREE